MSPVKGIIDPYIIVNLGSSATSYKRAVSLSNLQTRASNGYSVKAEV
jgi:hypothetical protein